MASDIEIKDFDKGTYSRSITLADASGKETATLILESDHFVDALVEQFPERYQPADFPKKQITP